MASRLIIAPEAEQEFLEAFAWYESKQTGLGQRFAREFGECLDSIVRNPLMAKRSVHLSMVKNTTLSLCRNL